MNFEYDEYYFSIDMISDYLFGGKAEDYTINEKDPARKVQDLYFFPLHYCLILRYKIE